MIFKINFVMFFSFLIVVFSCATSKKIKATQEISLYDLPSVLKTVENGTTILIKPGTYRDINLRIQSKEKKILVRPKNLGDVIITGKVENSVFTIVNSDGITFQGFLFEKVDRNVFGIFNSTGIEINNNYFYQCGSSPTNSLIRLRDGSSKNLISHNTFDDVWALGVVVATSSGNPRDEYNTDNQIFNNYFVNIPSVKSVYPESNGNGMECIQIGHDLDNTIGYQLNTRIFRNLFENVIGDGVEIISNKSSLNYISENTFLDNRSGVTIRSGNSVSFNNNYMENTTRGVRIYGADHQVYNNYIKNSSIAINLPTSDFKKGERMTRVGYFRPENIEVFDNYVINPSTSGIQIGTGSRILPPDNIRLRNNRIVIVGDTVQDIKVLESASRSDLSFNENQTFGSSDPRYAQSFDARSATRRREDFNDVNVKRFLGFSPFVSNDSNVGATWRRPNF